jgi:hypothetical protein
MAPVAGAAAAGGADAGGVGRRSGVPEQPLVKTASAKAARTRPAREATIDATL